nr:OmpA family protein [uncultured Dyadobacter sp.]
MKTLAATFLLVLAIGFSAAGQHSEKGNALTPPTGRRAMRPKVAIRVLDKYSLKPVRATIMLVGQRPGVPIAPRFEDGVYQFKVTVRDTIIISIHANGYEMLNESVPAGLLHATKVFYLTPKTASLNSNTVYTTSNIPVLHDDIMTVLHFPQSLPDILPESEQELKILADYLLRHETCRIELAGHTDDVGDPYKNMLLSYDRVDEVKKYLLARHIASSRIRGRGFGSHLPVAPNDSELNRRLNRRVEVKITL